MTTSNLMSAWILIVMRKTDGLSPSMSSWIHGQCRRWYFLLLSQKRNIEYWQELNSTRVWKIVDFLHFQYVFQCIFVYLSVLLNSFQCLSDQKSKCGRKTNQCSHGMNEEFMRKKVLVSNYIHSTPLLHRHHPIFFHLFCINYWIKQNTRDLNVEN